MRAEGGARLAWDEIDADVRAHIETALGAPVVAARNQPGGFSPGLAARCVLADGRRVFVKAVSRDVNAQAARTHRREIEVASSLPDHLPVPRLCGHHDDGRWVALWFDDVDGRQPAEPWTDDDLAVAARAVLDLRRRSDPSPAPELQRAEQRLGGTFGCFARLAGGDGPVDRVDPWVRSNLDRLATIEAHWRDAVAGTALLHGDLRADNMLRVGDDIVFVDWPHGCIGAGWVDVVCWLPSVGLGGRDPEAVAADHRLLDGVDPHALDTVVAAVAGFFVRASLDPDPPGLPRLRAYQAAQGEVAVEWLRRRVG